MNCPFKWTNRIDEEDEQSSSWESELEGEKPQEFASSEAPDDEGEWCWPKRNRTGKREDHRPTFHYLAEDDGDEQASGSLLNHLVQRNAGAQQTWKKVTVVVDYGAAENVMPKGMFPEISMEETERSKNGKGFKGPGGEHNKNYGQQVMSVRTPEGFVRKSIVAGRSCEKFSCVGISHHPSRKRPVHEEE